MGASEVTTQNRGGGRPKIRRFIENVTISETFQVRLKRRYLCD